MLEVEKAWQEEEKLRYTIENQQKIANNEIHDFADSMQKNVTLISDKISEMNTVLDETIGSTKYFSSAFNNIADMIHFFIESFSQITDKINEASGGVKNSLNDIDFIEKTLNTLHNDITNIENVIKQIDDISSKIKLLSIKSQI